MAAAVCARLHDSRRHPRPRDSRTNGSNCARAATAAARPAKPLARREAAETRAIAWDGRPRRAARSVRSGEGGRPDYFYHPQGVSSVAIVSVVWFMSASWRRDQVSAPYIADRILADHRLREPISAPYRETRACLYCTKLLCVALTRLVLQTAFCYIVPPRRQ